MNPDRIRFHDANFRPAWQRKFGREATMNERVIGEAVAMGETNEGDAWAGPDKIVGTADDERNKGATNLRKLDEHERIVLAAKGAELIAARQDIPIRPRKTDLDRLDFTEVGTRDTNGVAKPMRFRWLFHERGKLERGDENEDVKLWQAFLIMNTFEIGEVDGKFGPKVEAATREFQRSRGMLDDGIVDADLQHMADFVVLIPRELPITPLEAEALAPITPTVAKGHELRARAVNLLLGEALPTCPAGATPAPTAKFPNGAYGTIHCDSHPGLGPFMVWFASFATPKPDVEDEIDSWKYYLDILCRSEAERAALAAGSPSLMARAMYFQSYFGGFHVKGKLYESPKGSGNMVDGAELNIADYANVISRHAPSVRAALA